MEIWIIGGVLVALMVYLSTRIKKSAAQAFEAETIETGEFALVKPEGFLSPYNEDSEFAFEAYTKEFGETEGTERVRQAETKLRVIAGEDFASRCERARQSVDKILSEDVENAGAARKVFRLAGERAENGAVVIDYFKIIENENKIFDLRVSVLQDARDAYAERINKLLESFHVK